MVNKPQVLDHVYVKMLDESQIKTSLKEAEIVTKMQKILVEFSE